ncbi:hypothetical protein F511_26743 [Dorcoceras hygrometricum]|uniref:Uncharacterized protein n=1 Tax=Dorcoceras hygrometricum TaxID=472368 RepID=A0A2Z7CII0_9LAMI|nr:hypothetical protein F511_26743 [Dorcoceras hygrometricum]
MAPKNLSRGTGSQALTAAQIAQLVATTMEQVMADRPGLNPHLNPQLEEIQKLREGVSRLPPYFKFPNVEEYDGIGDPEEQLSRFKNVDFLHQYADPIKCRVFLITLVRSAQQWFNLFPAGKYQELPRLQ